MHLSRWLAAPVTVLAMTANTLAGATAAHADPVLSPFVPPPPFATTDTTLLAQVEQMTASNARAAAYVTAHPTTAEYLGPSFEPGTRVSTMNGLGREISALAVGYAYATTNPASVDGIVDPAWEALAIAGIDKFAEQVARTDDPRYTCDPNPYNDPAIKELACDVPDWTLSGAEIAEAAWMLWPSLPVTTQNNVLRATRVIADWTSNVNRKPCIYDTLLQQSVGPCRADAGPGEQSLGDFAWYRDLAGNVVPNRGNNLLVNGTPENSAAEELAWHERLLNVAHRMLAGTSQGAHVGHYQRFAVANGLSAFSTTDDYTKTVSYAGHPLCRWLKGSNADTNGGVRNHDVRSPVYMRTPHNYASYYWNGSVRHQANRSTLYGISRTYGGFFSLGMYKTDGSVEYPDGDSDNNFKRFRPAGPPELSNSLQAAFVLNSSQARSVLPGQLTKAMGLQNADGGFDPAYGSDGLFIPTLGDEVDLDPSLLGSSYGSTVDAFAKFSTTYHVLAAAALDKAVSGGLPGDIVVKSSTESIPYSGTAC